jgi:hypothetical protein
VVVSDVERMAQWRSTSAWIDDVDDDATLQAFHVIGDTKGGRKGGKGGGGGGGGRGRSGGKGGRGKRGQSRRFKEIEANLRELQPMTLEDRQTLRPPPRLAQFAQKEPDAARLLEHITRMSGYGSPSYDMWTVPRQFDCLRPLAHHPKKTLRT